MMNLSRGWAVLLLGSLALNFFGAGFLASNALFHVGAVANPVATLAAQPATVSAQTAQAQSPVVRKIVDTHGGVIAPRVRDMRAANEAVTAALTADPFDAGAFQRVLSDLRGRTIESQKAMHDALVTEAVGMSREQRHQLAAVSKSTPERLLLGY